MCALNRRNFVKKTTLGTAATSILTACSEQESQKNEISPVSGPDVNWRITTSFPPSVDMLSGAADMLANRVREMTNGKFRIRVFASGEIVPALQVMDAVQSGTVQAGHTSDYYYIGKNSALAFGTSIPFGFNSRQQTAWLTQGGGQELLREVYSDFGIMHFHFVNTGAQFGGWFREPVESLNDLRGVRMRIPGLAGEIMSRLGVTVQVLGAADIYPALERGAIDATEWVGPYDDEKLGFHEIAKNYYIPGWWEPGPSTAFQINRAAWDELPEQYQEILACALSEVNLVTLARYDAENPRVLKRLVEEHDVIVREFPTDILEEAWKESNSYLEEQSSANPDFRKIYQSWNAFRKESFPYFAGNESVYGQFAFPKL
jgi:TRAP-type mannitol/chloroaromatic compound transport system substrate-binding protein